MAKKHPDRMRAACRHWRRRHPDKQRKSTYKWRQKNREAWNAYQRRCVRGIRSMFGVQPDEGIYRSGEIQLNMPLI